VAGKGKYSIGDLERDLRKQTVAPVYVVEGEEALLATQATQAIVDAVLPAAARDFNLGVFSGDDETGRKFLAEARSFPFLTEKRVVILRRFDRIKLDEREENEFLDYLKSPAATTVLVLVTPKLDRRTTLAKELDKRARVVGADALNDAELPDWVQARFAARGSAVSNDACRLRIDLAGPGLLDLGNEIDKLLARYSEVKKIEPTHVESTVDRNRPNRRRQCRRFRPDNAAFMKISPGFSTEPEDEIFKPRRLMA
jgi:DNA polymerase-3 subunit delta